MLKKRDLKVVHLTCERDQKCPLALDMRTNIRWWWCCGEMFRLHKRVWKLLETRHVLGRGVVKRSFSAVHLSNHPLLLMSLHLIPFCHFLQYRLTLLRLIGYISFDHFWFSPRWSFFVLGLKKDCNFLCLGFEPDIVNNLRGERKNLREIWLAWIDWIDSIYTFHAE